jgi:hypothetical protein
VIVGEALNRRSDLQKRIAQLQSRVAASVLTQEGEQPPESVETLMAEADSLCEELQRLIAQINRTNASARLSTGETVTEGLARRDVLVLRQDLLRMVVRTATSSGLSRYSRSEIRMVRQVQVADVQRAIDALARQRRVLETRLQEHNWTTQLLE